MAEEATAVTFESPGEVPAEPAGPPPESADWTPRPRVTDELRSNRAGDSRYTASGSVTQQLRSAPVEAEPVEPEPVMGPQLVPDEQELVSFHATRPDVKLALPKTDEDAIANAGL